MITKQDLLESIAECQGIRNPNANTCLKLAAFYTILDHMADDSASSDKTEDSGRAYSAKMPVSFGATEEAISYRNNSEFAQAINGMPSADIWSIMDELMSMLQMIEPKLYSAVMRKIEDVQ